MKEASSPVRLRPEESACGDVMKHIARRSGINEIIDDRNMGSYMLNRTIESVLLCRVPSISHTPERGSLSITQFFDDSFPDT